jgi:AcrR family transcriptional regulator
MPGKAIPGKATPGKASKDRRVQRTEKLLHGALASLIQEKRYDSIVVKEILERADVGRSTFYTHFRDKDDLLIGAIHDILSSAQPTALPRSASRSERLVWFSLPIFEHLDQHRHSSTVKTEAGGWTVVHNHLQQVLTEVVADDLRGEPRIRPDTPRVIPPELLAAFVASTFVLVLNWWVESRRPLPPNEVDALFRSLIVPSLAAVLD